MALKIIDTEGEGKPVELIGEWIVPLKTVSEANMSEHWTKAHKRHKAQKIAIKLYCNALKTHRVGPGDTIVLSRLSSRRLDYVNLVVSLKWIQDAVAEIIFPSLAPGRADDEKHGIIWHFEQEIAKKQAVRVQLFKENANK